MKHEVELELDEFEVDEYDDFQYEMSTEIAQCFIDEQVLPAVLEFDFQNPDADYVPGVASFNLYFKLVEKLLIEGFTPEQLKEVIDDFDVNEVFLDQIH